MDREWDQYVHEWVDIGRPIADATDTELLGLDPGFLFRDSMQPEIVCIPKWFAERLQQALENKAI